MIIKNANIVNNNTIYKGNLIIKNGVINKIIKGNLPQEIKDNNIIDAKNNFLLPGVIDDHVHFREPGLTNKADIYSESRAAVAGGITSYMEMPNTIPQTTSIELLEEKFLLAKANSFANYSFYLGATNKNIDEIKKINPKEICGIKLFMGSSTGNMLVDKESSLENIFKESKILLAVHCEDDKIIQENIELYKTKFGASLPIEYHSKIRSSEACYKSSSLAVKLAKKFNVRLHILHISTAKELELFKQELSIDKKITAEVTIHHLWFNDKNYSKYGTKIKWNPSIKTEADRTALLKGLLSNKIDVIGTDHAPHLYSEKNNSYFKAPSGGPMVQHALSAMLELHKKGLIKLEKIVEKMCHTPADIFQIHKRGYIKEGYYADLVIVDLDNKYTVNKDNILYKCNWSPFEQYTFNSKITHTIINGKLVYDNGKIIENVRGQRLIFDR
ncbi:MAG: dihydroorotase [Bacteroidales bacterium]|jgi:dihydroorotase|nr:dihydroorotase [Bacteroidales bacterium]